MSAPVVADPRVRTDDVVIERSALEPPWTVVVWNDPINLMSYVTYVFRKLFGYSEARAHELMMQVHTQGRATVAGGNRERCEYDVSRLHAHGLWASLQQE
jgi:ATP-dependent Clp protease adaptor protein ClpS